MYFFSADEHYYHNNIIEHCSRPFENFDEMNETLISNHNSMVGKNDITVHVGDFVTIKDKQVIYKTIIRRLNGKHIFLKGSHDYWLKGTKSNQIWEKNLKIDGKRYHFVACHYAMRVWPRSHYNSFLIYGHSHGKLEPIGKQFDCGVDPNNFFPVSAKEIIEKMKNQPNNFNFIKKQRR